MGSKLFSFAFAAMLLTYSCGSTSYSTNSAEGSAQFNQQLAQGQEISLEVDGRVGADVTVVASNSRMINLKAVPSNRFSGINLTSSNNPRLLVLRLDASGSRQHYFRWLFNYHADATITLNVPTDATVSIRAANGSVRVVGVHGPTSVDIINGLISVNDTGSVLGLHLINGEIDAQISDLSQAPNIDISGTNGSIDVTVPDDFKARIDARTLIGPVDQDVNGSHALGNVRLRLITGPIVCSYRRHRDGSPAIPKPGPKTSGS